MPRILFREQKKKNNFFEHVPGHLEDLFSEVTRQLSSRNSDAACRSSVPVRTCKGHGPFETWSKPMGSHFGVGEFTTHFRVPI